MWGAENLWVQSPLGSNWDIAPSSRKPQTVQHFAATKSSSEFLFLSEAGQQLSARLQRRDDGHLLSPTRVEPNHAWWRSKLLCGLSHLQEYRPGPVVTNPRNAKGHQ